MSRVLILGAGGQLGCALTARLPDALAWGRTELDLASSRQIIADAVGRAAPDVIVNAAAYTAVDKAESEPALAFQINAHVPEALAVLGIPLIHLSTDYVFPGDTDRPYRESDPTRPVNWYGQSKLEGENEVRQAGGTVLRTSWVYDGQRPNFAMTMIRLGQRDGAVRVVDDQIGRPTFAGDLADAILAVLRKPKPGLYHVQGSGPSVSWAGFAKAIFDQVGINATVQPIPSSAYPTPARRPAYSVLDCSAFQSSFGHVLPDWRDSLTRAFPR